MGNLTRYGLIGLLGSTALTAGVPAAMAQEATFEPVTTERLLDPAPGDWLMWRRTYDAHAHSPLDQINTDNVGELELVWAWGMEPGTNQPAPLVSNGIMYLPNSGDVVQAFNAATGDLLWEYRRELPDEADAENPSRVIALYEDKAVSYTHLTLPTKA